MSRFPRRLLKSHVCPVVDECEAEERQCAAVTIQALVRGCRGRQRVRELRQQQEQVWADVAGA